MNYLFIINDIFLGELAISASDIVEILKERGEWVFSSQMPFFKSLKKGDKVIVYLAGKNRKYFYAYFTISGEISDNRYKSASDGHKLLDKFFRYSAAISAFKTFHQPVSIYSVKEELEFITDKKNWGLFFRQAIKKVSERDYNLIISQSNDN